MTWRKIICWLKGHKMRVMGDWMTAFKPYYVLRCQRCGHKELVKSTPFIPENWGIMEDVKPFEVMFPAPS